METNIILEGDDLEQLKTLPDNSIDMCITSPPYWALRDYGVQGQLGLEQQKLSSYFSTDKQETEYEEEMLL